LKGIYAILDESNFNFSSLEKSVKYMIKYNIKIFQIRIKSSFSKKNISIIKKIKFLCKNHKCLLILNDNVNLANELELDGVHVGSGDADISSVRSTLGENKIIGVSCYNDINLALSSEKLGASYISFGSLYKTTTKLNPINLDISTVKNASKILKIPICLIGGINTNNVHDVIKLNCDLIAISKGLSSNNEIENISKIYYE